MQIRKQQLELDMEQQTGSKLGEEYVKAVHCEAAYLTYIQVSQEASKVVWYSHLFNNFPQLAVIHTVKGFGIVDKAEVDVFSGIILPFL